MEIFFEISVIVSLATLLAILVSLLKQPLIISYILTGIIAGPYLFNIINSNELLTTFSHLGISLLLFVVGLGLNPRIIRETGQASLVTGLGQVIFTSIIGFFICRAFGFSLAYAAYAAVAMTFSSTIIIMKLLSDKGETETLHGRIAIGFLIVQDLVAILALMALSSLGNGEVLFSHILSTLLKGFGLLSLLTLVGYLLIPKFLKYVALSQELLLLFSVAWVTALAALFHIFGFSIESGALLAGVLLSLSPYRYEIASKMRPLRDFFIVIFFILLGTQMSFGDIGHQLVPIIFLSLFILIGNPLIVMVLMGWLGYTKKTGFLCGLTVAQISEFSLILIALGVKMEHIPHSALSFMTAVGLITIAGSTYMILYSDPLYRRLGKYLGIFEFNHRSFKPELEEAENHDIILFGYNRTGYDVLKALRKLGQKLLVVDYSPDIIASLSREGVNCKYGDASDTELLAELNLGKAKLVISTVPDFDTNLLLLSKIRERNKHSIVIIVSHQAEEALILYNRGATYVIIPNFLGGYHAAAMIEGCGLDLNKFMLEQAKHISYLEEHKYKGEGHAPAK